MKAKNTKQTSNKANTRNKPKAGKSTVSESKNAHIGLIGAITAIFQKHQNKHFNYKEISSKLGIRGKEERQKVADLLSVLAEQAVLESLDKGAYKLKFVQTTLVGTIDISSKGTGFVAAENLEQDILIPSNLLGGAMPGDTVQVALMAAKGRGRIEGEVVSIVQRAREFFVGTLQVNAKFAFLIPDSKAVQTDIFVPLSGLKEGKNGQKAIVKIVEWPKAGKNAIGEVTELLGLPGEHDTEMKSIIAEFGFPLQFPDAVVQQAEQIPLQISQSEIAKRRDFRAVETFTIDPEDAKDFDDAISFQVLENGHLEIGVHIADVSFYVPQNTALDKEAYRRATSVYLVDRVVPMLPEHLSNLVCSLRPNEEKLTFSAVFEMDNAGYVYHTWIGRTVINSNKRFSYEEAQQVLDGTLESPYKTALFTLNELAHKMRDKRFESGAIKFESPEIKFKLNANNQVEHAYVKDRKDAHMLIEDFMLLANKAVATYVWNLAKGNYRNSFVYRIHDAPDADRIKKLRDFVALFDYKIDLKTPKRIAYSINDLVAALQGKPEQKIIENMAIRSMAKAVYSTKNIGHYGLAFDNYTHFTSPIRRYPDLMVHRLLQQCFDNQKPANQMALENDCKHCSAQEKQAAQAERASTKYKQMEMLKDKIGMQFDGQITGMQDYGFYVELNYNYCDGLVRLASINDDRYVLDEETYTIVGIRTGRKLTLGDTVVVKLLKLDFRARTLDLELISAQQDY